MNFKNLAMWAVIVFLTIGLYNMFKNPQGSINKTNNKRHTINNKQPTAYNTQQRTNQPPTRMFHHCTNNHTCIKPSTHKFQHQHTPTQPMLED